MFVYNVPQAVRYFVPGRYLGRMSEIKISRYASAVLLLFARGAWNY